MSDLTDQLVQAASDSLFKPENLQDIRCRLSFIQASECNCVEGPHENALHDLVDDDVPVLLKVIDQLAAEVERLRAAVGDATEDHRGYYKTTPICGTEVGIHACYRDSDHDTLIEDEAHICLCGLTWSAGAALVDLPRSVGDATEVTT